MRAAKQSSVSLGQWRMRMWAGLACVAWGLALAAPAAEPPDAVIQYWDRAWTLNPDGSATKVEELRVQLNDERAYEEFADFRIPYDDETQQLKIFKARTKLADGSYREAADYAHVIVAPGGPAGWPAFAGLREHVLVMPAVEPGCVLEIAYGLTTKPGTRPYLAGEVRLDAHYPVELERVAVAVPRGQAFHWVAQRAGDGAAKPAEEDLDAGDAPMHMYEWTFTRWPGQPHEPQAPSWRQMSPRLLFSTAPSASAWFETRLKSLAAAATLDDPLREYAADWTADALGPDERLAALQEKLAERFSRVDFAPDLRPWVVRPAAVVLRGQYGTDAEGAALLLALAQAAEIKAYPALVINEVDWVADTPVESLVEAYGVAFDGPSGSEIWTLADGRLQRDVAHAGRRAEWLTSDGVQAHTWQPWGTEETRCVVRGRLKLDEAGRATGVVDLEAAGWLAADAALQEQGKPEDYARRLVQNVLPGAQVSDVRVQQLADTRVTLTVDVELPEAAAEWHGVRRLALAEDAALPLGVHVPAANGPRTQPVQLPGTFRAELDLRIEWPADWELTTVPTPLDVQTAQARVQQSSEKLDGALSLRRAWQADAAVIDTSSFVEWRKAVGTLGAEHARTLLFETTGG